MPYNERNNNSRFEEKYPDSAFINAVKATEPAGTREVANHVGCHINNARRRLNKLANDDILKRTQTARRYVYTLP